jgi:prepilin-type N-terminal cleavage/methylation domain-containing protein/prepilin-type processing-associated H-X9-DG protein
VAQKYLAQHVDADNRLRVRISDQKAAKKFSSQLLFLHRPIREKISEKCLRAVQAGYNDFVILSSKRKGAIMQNNCVVGKRKGFTLIELLVVIAIIAILAAILFPVFARARENARRASCQSNLKQIALGIFQYTQDYDEKFPMGYYPMVPENKQTDPSMPGAAFKVSTGAAGFTPDYYKTWMDMIYPYLKSTQIFVCPSATSSTTAPSYGYNRLLSNTTGATSGGDSLASVERPSEIVMNMDYNWVYSAYANCIDGGNVALGTNVTNQKIVAPHLDGTNVAFADGHVKWRVRTDGVFWNNSEATNRFWNPALP